MVLQDADLKNPEKTRQGKARKRREDQRRQGKQKMARASQFGFAVEQGVRNKRLW